jgi:hypothetical protein
VYAVAAPAGAKTSAAHSMRSPAAKVFAGISAVRAGGALAVDPLHAVLTAVPRLRATAQLIATLQMNSTLIGNP